MLRRRDEQIRKELPAFKGGKGAVQVSVLLTSEELLGKGRVFNRMVLEQAVLSVPTPMRETLRFFIFSVAVEWLMTTAGKWCWSLEICSIPGMDIPMTCATTRPSRWSFWR